MIFTLIRRRAGVLAVMAAMLLVFAGQARQAGAQDFDLVDEPAGCFAALSGTIEAVKGFVLT